MEPGRECTTCRGFPARWRSPPGQRPTEEVDRCVPQELSLDCCLENERVLGHTGRLLVDIHLLCWGLLGLPWDSPDIWFHGRQCQQEITRKSRPSTKCPGDPSRNPHLPSHGCTGGHRNLFQSCPGTPPRPGGPVVACRRRSSRNDKIGEDSMGRRVHP